MTAHRGNTRRPLAFAAALAFAATLAACLVVALPAPSSAGDDDRGRRDGSRKKDRVVYAAPRRGYVFVPGHYEARETVRYVPGPLVSVWVPPRFGVRFVDGRLGHLALSPGHYRHGPGPLVPVREVVKVWVPDRWMPVARLADRRGGRD